MGIPVVAVARGYFGSVFREPGDRFELANQGEFSKVWMELLGDGAPVNPVAPSTAPVLTPGLVAIPADWRSIHYAKRIAIAKAISGLDDVNAELAIKIIEAEAAGRDDIARGVTKAPALTAEQVAIADAERIAAEADAADAASENGADFE